MNQADAKAMGHMSWMPSAKNRSLVETALEEVVPEQITRSRYLAFYQNILVLQGSTWILDGPQLLLARKFGIVDKLPSVTDDELDDKNKGDFLVKLIAVTQIGWLAAQLLARVVEQIPTSQLEIVTLAFAFTSLGTYGMLWSKPQDCKKCIEVPAARRPSVQELIEIADKGPLPIVGSIRRRNWMPGNTVHEVKPGVNQVLYAAAGNMIGATIFGALHFMAWNSHFPTATERLLWHIACITTTVMPPTGLAVHWLARRLFLCIFRRNTNYRAQHWVLVIVITFFLFMYFVARLYITVEIFRSLFYLPPEAFTTTWASNWPHVS